MFARPDSGDLRAPEQAVNRSGRMARGGFDATRRRGKVQGKQSAEQGASRTREASVLSLMREEREILLRRNGGLSALTGDQVGARIGSRAAATIARSRKT